MPTDKTPQQIAQDEFETVMAINEQVLAAKDADSEEALTGRLAAKLAGRIDDRFDEILGKSGFTDAELNALSIALDKLAPTLTPKVAVTQWRSDDVQDMLKGLLNGAGRYGLISPEQVAELKAASEHLKAGGGERAPKQDAERIPNKAPYIVFTDWQGNDQGKSRGNTKNSPTNATGKLTGMYPESALTAADVALAKERVRQAIDGAIVTFGSGEDLVTLTPAHENEAGTGVLKDEQGQPVIWTPTV